MIPPHRFSHLLDAACMHSFPVLERVVLTWHSAATVALDRLESVRESTCVLVRFLPRLVGLKDIVLEEACSLEAPGKHGSLLAAVSALPHLTSLTIRALDLSRRIPHYPVSNVCLSADVSLLTSPAHINTWRFPSLKYMDLTLSRGSSVVPCSQVCQVQTGVVLSLIHI